MARGGGSGGRSGGGFRGGHTYHHTGASDGCFGRFRLLMLPIWLVLLILAQCSNMPSHVTYNESKLSEFAECQYELAFHDSGCYEDNLLLAFLVYDNRSDYSYMTWVGDHITAETFALLGGNESLLGQTLEVEIAYGYQSTLTADLEHTLDALAAGILEASPNGSIICSEEPGDGMSHLINHSEIALHESRLNNALTEFTDHTGIPIVLVVEDAKDVFD